MASTHKTVATTVIPRRPAPDFRYLFMDQLRKIYWAEKQLLKLIPRMEQASASLALAGTFRKNLDHAQHHVDRLEQVFEMLELEACGKKCKAMAGLIREIDELLSTEDMDADIRDTGLMLASRKIDYYEIASYNSLQALASKVDLSRSATPSKDHSSMNRLFTIYRFVK